MAHAFPFKLVTPTGVAFEGSVEQVTASNEIGEFGVLAEHINFITSLIPGLVTLKLADNSYRRFVIHGGLAEVKDGEMTVLTPEAVPAEKVSRDIASRELQAAEEKLQHLSFYEPEYVSAVRELQLARARQRAIELSQAA